MRRRKFLKTAAAASTGAFVIPRFSIGQPGPSANSKFNIAHIGAGGIASMAYSGCKEENVVALCDIDSRQFPNGIENQWALNVPKFADYREMLDKLGSEIDGVCINTPDHTHFNATLACMERGIHVCSQKPLTHNVWQARTLRKAKDYYQVVTNMANQGHTYDGIRKMREMYEADCFGQVQEVHLGFSGPNWSSKYFKKPLSMPLSADPIPAEVDWDLWLGPAAEHAYNSDLHPLTWRGFNDFGTGQLGDWFCHIGDGPVWVLDLYEPTVIECVERGPALEGMIPDYSVVRFDFPARGNKQACSMTWYDGAENGGTPIQSQDDWGWGKLPGAGSFWYADKGNAFLDLRSNNPRYTVKEQMVAFKQGGGVAPQYARVQGGPHREWIRAIKD